MNRFDIVDEPSSEAPRLPIPACTAIVNCPLPTDITLVSSDGHRFGAHCKNLGDFTGGFPVDIAPANGEDVPISDLDSKTLRLFLQYVHHHRQPDLSGIPFKSMFQLAEAVEKYDVYSATEICKVQMRRFVQDHSVEVFQYAAKNDYSKLLDEAAHIAIQNRYLSQKVPTTLTNRPNLLAAWDKYTHYWLGLFNDCYDEPPEVTHPGGVSSCRFWRKFQNVVTSQVRRETTIFPRFDSIVEGAKHYLKDCRHCGIRADRWTRRVAGKTWAAESMAKFSSFM